MLVVLITTCFEEFLLKPMTENQALTLLNSKPLSRSKQAPLCNLGARH